MRTIALSVPTGSHHRALLQPLRDFFVREPDWNILVISPGAPWADNLFPADVYPRARFMFAEIKTEKWDAPETRAMLELLYGEYRPALAITTTTGRDPLDRPILSLAKDRGIDTCTYVESWDNVWKMARKRAQQVLPDHLIVWNEIMKDHVLREFPELTPDRVSVTGSPRLDIAAHPEMLPSREEVLTALGLDPARRLLHFSTVELYDMTHVARDIADAHRRGAIPKDLQLLATIHPGGNIERQRAWADPLGFTVRHAFGRADSGPHPDFLYNPSQHDMDLLMALFRHEDVLVNFSSTVALEAMLMDTPTIGVMYGKPWDWGGWRRSAVVRDFREHYADLVRGGGVRIVKNRRQLIAAITDALEHPETDREGRRRSCETIMTTLSGNASEMTFEVIRRLV